MRDEDEIISAYEAEFKETTEPRRRSGRGFWLVAGAMALACVFLLVEILVNRPIGDSIAHAESTLRDAQTGATTVHDRSGSFANADADGMALADPSNTYVAGDVASADLDQVSVATRSDQWAGAVQARPGACFYLRLTDAGGTFYGAGTDCTGRSALTASGPSW